MDGDRSTIEIKHLLNKLNPGNQGSHKDRVRTLSRFRNYVAGIGAGTKKGSKVRKRLSLYLSLERKEKREREPAFLFMHEWVYEWSVCIACMKCIHCLHVIESTQSVTDNPTYLFSRWQLPYFTTMIYPCCCLDQRPHPNYTMRISMGIFPITMVSSMHVPQ